MRAVLFDVDGVLIDSLSAHRVVWGRWARHHGLDVKIVWQATFGRRPEDTVMMVAPDLNVAEQRAYLDRLLEACGARLLLCPARRRCSADFDHSLGRS